MDVGKSHGIAFSMGFRGIVNVSLSRVNNDTLFTERDTMIKACDTKVA